MLKELEIDDGFAHASARACAAACARSSTARTRSATDEIASRLTEGGVATVGYHAGLVGACGGAAEVADR